MAAGEMVATDAHSQQVIVKGSLEVMRGSGRQYCRLRALEEAAGPFRSCTPADSLRSSPGHFLG